MSTRLVLPILALALVAAACGEPPLGEVDFGSGRAFVPEVVDSIDDVGMGAAVAIDAEGVPFVSYLGFVPELAEGEIAVTRPVGAPSVPGVLLASQRERVWNRGAVALAQDPPERVTVPFGPATVESLADASPGTMNGTDVAVGADGAVHVAWAGADGIWYAAGPEPFTAEKVFSRLPPVSQSGPLGWPSVAVEEGGAPWVAATVDTIEGQDVIAATPEDEGWDVQTVVSLPACADCPDPGRTGVVVTPDGPVVVFVDPQQGVMAARPDGRGWTVETVEAGVDGTGLSVAGGADGSIAAAYYASRDSVHVATFDGAAWRSEEAAALAASGGGGEEESTAGRTTGVAQTEDGTVYLTYVDPAQDAVVLASAAEGGFEPIETRATEGGRWPDVAVTPDGATVSLAWYAPEQQNLAFGTFAEVSGITVAAPSPPFEVSTDAGGSAEECTADAVEPTTELVVTALPGATANGFEETCLVAPADQPLTLTFDHQDPGQSHNADFLLEAGSTESLFTSGEPVIGPATQGPEDVEPQEVGDYYFQCDVHPTMNGAFVVVKAKAPKN